MCYKTPWHVLFHTSLSKMLFLFGILHFLVTILARITLVVCHDQMEAGETRHFDLLEDDALSNKLGIVDDARYGFPGDLIVGYRLPNEAVYTRSISIINPTDEIKTGVVTFSVPRGEFHYVRAINRAGSVGVMCEEPYIIGGPQTGFRVRSQPNSEVLIDVTFAAH